MKKLLLNKKTNVFIATFSRYEKDKRLPTNGFVDQLLSFFKPKVNRIVLLDGPHPVGDHINPIVEEYSGQKLVSRYVISSLLYFPIYLFCLLPSKNPTRLSFKFRDLFAVFYVILFKNQKFDLFIGLEGIYGIAGIILKQLGKVDTVVYYVSDYAPKRFKNNLLNSIYLWLDRFCVEHADFTWDVSSAMLSARLDAGLSKKFTKKIIHVPNALFENQIKSLPISKRAPLSLVYMGILDPDQGSDFAIEVVSVLTKKFPTLTLHIVGGTRDEVGNLKKLVKKLKTEKNIHFYGFVESNTDMAKIVRGCMIGLAPYRSFSDSFRWYGDAGKIRQYMASGLPVVTTHVPPLGKIVAEKGAALVRQDTIEDFAQGIEKLLTDKKLYAKMVKKAEDFGKSNTWENSYTHAFFQMGFKAN